MRSRKPTNVQFPVPRLGFKTDTLVDGLIGAEVRCGWCHKIRPRGRVHACDPRVLRGEIERLRTEQMDEKLRDYAYVRLQNESKKLRAVAEAARNLVAGARDIDLKHAKVDEPALVALETALAAAEYDT
jgi:hypothetical protein